jgi:hypothetical protein
MEIKTMILLLLFLILFSFLLCGQNFMIPKRDDKVVWKCILIAHELSMEDISSSNNVKEIM